MDFRTFAVRAAAALLMTLATLTAAADGAPPGSIRIPGHKLEPLPNLKALPRSATADSNPLILTVVLKIPPSAALEAFVAQFNDRGSPAFHAPIASTAFTARFGPTQASYDSVREYLQRQGFDVLETSAQRTTLTVHGTRALAERAFAIRIADFQRGVQRIHAALDDPAVPAELRSLIQFIDGLTSPRRAHPNLAPTPPQPASIMQAYNVAGFPQMTGAGQSIVLLEDNIYRQEDVVDWLALPGTPGNGTYGAAYVESHVSAASVPAVAQSSQDSQDGRVEVLLDVAAVLGTAPGAQVTVLSNTLNYDSDGDNYQANETEFYAAAIKAAQVDGGTGGVISNSWTSCEGTSAQAIAIQDAVNSLLTSAAYSGTTLFVASGDNGDIGDPDCDSYGPNVEYPADLPAAVAVGGTSLITSVNNSYFVEDWLDADLASSPGSAGFGTSQTQPKPYWQFPYTASSQRSIPDVVADADPNTGIALPPVGAASCSPCMTGGTSLAAPLWAAGWALISQAFGSRSAGLGFVYSLAYIGAIPATECNYLFHTAACMDPYPGAEAADNDFAHVGLGSFNLSNLMSVLSGVPYIASSSPMSGPERGGTRVSVGGFFPSPSTTSFWIGANPSLQIPGLAARDTVCSLQTCTFVTPQHLPGNYSVVPRATAGTYLGGTRTVWGEITAAGHFQFVVPCPWPFCRPE